MKKKALAVALSMALCFGAALPSFAALPTNDADITPEWAEGVTHSYEAYQIFTGEEYQGKLINVKWGDAAGTAVKDALWAQFVKDAADIGEVRDADGKIIEFTDERKATATAEDYAHVIEKYQESTKIGVGAEKLAAIINDTVDKGENAAKYAVSSNHITDVDTPGWYLVVDTTQDLIDAEAKTKDNYTAYMDRAQLRFTWNGDITIKTKHTHIYVDKEVADINDSINVSYDEWSDSADYDVNDDVPFRITGTVPEDYDTYTTFEYTFQDDQSAGLSFNNDVTVYLDTDKDDDVKGTDITSYFTTTVGTNGHSFEIKCEDLKKVPNVTSDSYIVAYYTSKLTGEKVEYGYDGNPNHARIHFKNDVHGEGDTPFDIAIVFTFIPEVDKVNSKLEPLTGAEFTISKLVKGEDGKEAEWATVKRADGTDYAYKMTVDAAGTHFSFKGIDDGIYRVTESKVPDGFNKVDDIYFVVEAKHDVKNKLTELVVKDLKGNVLGSDVNGQNVIKDVFTVTRSTGTATTIVINQEGVVLPSTGGIGTTIFYIVGGVLVVGAVVLLIVRRRMRTEEE